jgi:hypothetical protein
MSDDEDEVSEDEFEYALSQLKALARPITQEDIDRAIKRWGPIHFMTRALLGVEEEE